jgi:hypothetical protein
MVNLSTTPLRPFLPRAEDLLSPPPLKRRRMNVNRITFLATSWSPVASPLLLPDLLGESVQPQEGIPTIFLKPRPSMGVRRKSRLPLSKLTDVRPLTLIFEDVASVKRRCPSLSFSQVSSSAGCA